MHAFIDAYLSQMYMYTRIHNIICIRFTKVHNARVIKLYVH